MTFIRLVEKDEVPPEVRAIFESGEQRHGQVLNAWRAVAHNPVVFQAYVPYLMAVFGPGALNQRIKDLIAIRIALLNHCRYTVSHRVVAARKQGISDEDLLGLLDPPDYAYSPAEQAALAFAGELTTGVADISCADNPQGVGTDTLQRLKAHYSDTEISELALSVSLWNALTRFHRVMDLDLDMPPPPPELDAAL